MTLNEQMCIAWGTVFGATIRGFIMKTIVARILAFFGSDVMKKIISCIPQIVAEVEQAMKDGKITQEERKQIALDTINLLASKFGIKISGIMAWVISVIIDNIAQKLPTKDIVVPNVVSAAITNRGV